jgi:hypothetical protein
MAIYVLIGIVEAVTVGVIAWGTGSIVWRHLSKRRQSRRRESD